MTRRALALIVLAACSSSKKEKEPEQEPSPAPAVAHDAAAYQPSGDKPANARRQQALDGMLAGAVAVGAAAPAIDLPATSGARFRLGDALSKTERVVIVFYRGDW